MILCLSDIHLGSPVCQAELTLKLLEETKYEKLIICGDVLDSYNIHRLCKKQGYCYETYYYTSLMAAKRAVLRNVRRNK